MSDIAVDAVQSTHAARETRSNAWWILATVLTVEIMDILDGTIVNVAIPSIRLDMGASSTALQWIVGGYALTFAVGLIIGGRLGDIYGRKKMFLLGVVVFTLTSLLCGLAPTPEWLILTRLLQGFGAAIMIPQGFGIIVESFSEEDMPKAFAMWGPMVALGAVLGPIIGGLLIELNAFDTDWRGVFLVNVPIGIVAYFAARRVLPDARQKPDTAGIDLAGAAIMAGALGLLIFPMIEGREQDWPAWIFVMFGAGLAVLVGFVWFERRRQSDGKTTLIEPSLFGKKVYLSGTVILTVFFAALGGLLLVQIIYLQVDQHFSAIHAGLTLVAWSLGTAIGATLGQAVLLAKIGRSLLHLGTLVMAAGVVALLFVLSADGHAITTWDLAPPMLLLGIGLGMLISPLFSFILAGVGEDELGSASGVLNTMQQLGGATGVALIGTMFFAVAEDDGILAGFERSLVVILGGLVLIGVLIFMLPMKARED